MNHTPFATGLTFDAKLQEAKAAVVAFDVTVAYLAVGGSYAHGFATEDSDVDLRGVYMPSLDAVTAMAPIERNLRRESPNADVNLSTALHFAHGIYRNDVQIYEMLAVPANLVLTDNGFTLDARFQLRRFMNRSLFRQIVRTAQGQFKHVGEAVLVPGTKEMKKARHAFRLMDLAYRCIETHKMIVEHPNPQAVLNLIDSFDRRPSVLDAHLMRRGKAALAQIDDLPLPETAPLDQIETMVQAHYRKHLLGYGATR